MTNTYMQNAIEKTDVSDVVEKHIGHKNLAAALAKAQMELKNPAMDKTNPYFNSKYSSLAAVRDAVVPILAKNGIAVMQMLSNNSAGDMMCITKLLHVSGESAESSLSFPSQKKDVQSLGSVATYLRRYSLQSMVVVVGDDDDDGNAAADNKKPAKKEGKAEERKAEFEEAKKELDKKLDNSSAIITTITKISQKKGMNAKGEYTVYTIYGENDKYSTFDANVATLAKTAKDAGMKVAIVTKGDKYNSIEAIDIFDAEPPITEADLKKMSDEAFDSYEKTDRTDGA